MPRTAASDIASRVVGREIRRARREARLTQSEVAGRLGASPSYIANVEAGRVNLTLGQLARVADAIGSDFDVKLFPAHVPRVAVEEPPARRDS